MWTREALHDLVRTKLVDYRLIVVGNREPYIHVHDGDRIRCQFPASGMVTAIDPLLRACGGIWVAHGSGSADRQTTDARDHVQVPPDDPSYTLRRVWLDPADEEGYYDGISNGGLWPLCHITFTRPVFHPKDWEAYRRVNQKFAQAVLEEAAGAPTFVFVQDFHFGLLPRLLKEANPKLVVAQFWHIPWPNPEVFRVFPWHAELIDGMLGNDLLGFHLRYHCQNFLETVDRTFEALVDRERSDVMRGGRSTLVRPFAISIDYERHSAQAGSEEVTARVDQWKTRLGLTDEIVGLGIDRLDYTKGIPERLRGLDRFLERNPQYVGRLVLVQVGVPTRTHVPQYAALDDEVDALVWQLNSRWRRDGWQPVLYVKEHQGQTDLMALHRLAHFCLVTSLHDGLNLVAKEYVASRNDDDGALILSQFAGAARELTDALLVNPFAIDEIADAIRHAIEMSASERKRRMVRMRANVAANNIYRWAGKVLSALLKLDVPES